MSETLLFTIATLSLLGVLFAVVLYFVANKFKVYEDPRIDEVEKMLPGANCGGCGFPGCRKLAEELVTRDEMDGLYCSVAGKEVMEQIASYLGKAAAVVEPKVAVIKCKGSCDVRPKTSEYDGAKSCRIAASLYAGETGCQYGCLGLGDCEVACAFGAISIDKETGLPVVDADKCTACGACVKACPKMVIELRKRGVRERRIYVACNNKDKGGVARKACKSACIGCGKCVKTCGFEAITLENSLAYIDPAKCKLCRKCAAECPTGAIVEVNFPPRPPKKDAPAKPAAPAAAAKATEAKPAPAAAKPAPAKAAEAKPAPAAAKPAEATEAKPAEAAPKVSPEANS